MLYLFLALVVVIAAILVYWPILKRAREDMTERTQAGLSNSVVYAVLLLPFIGPFLYLALRRQFQVGGDAGDGSDE